MSLLDELPRWCRIERLTPWIALTPIPAWFALTAIFTASPAWHARYRAEPGGPVVAQGFDRDMSHLWSGKFAPELPEGVPETGFVAQYDACLTARAEGEVRFMLVTDGSARFLLDGVEQLVAKSDRERGVAGKAIQLAPGSHHLRVEFVARKRPSIGLLASFTGEVPAALGSGRVAPGVTVSRPGADDEACSH